MTHLADLFNPYMISADSLLGSRGERLLSIGVTLSGGSEAAARARQGYLNGNGIPKSVPSIIFFGPDIRIGAVLIAANLVLIAA